MVRAPLGPAPLDPRVWGFIVFVVIFILLSLTDLDVLVVVPITFLSTAGAYYSIIRPLYERRLAIWRDTMDGARVCMKCWAAFK